jgi:hypothetical protein
MKEIVTVSMTKEVRIGVEMRVRVDDMTNDKAAERYHIVNDIFNDINQTMMEEIIDSINNKYENPCIGCETYDTCEDEKKDRNVPIDMEEMFREMHSVSLDSRRDTAGPERRLSIMKQAGMKLIPIFDKMNVFIESIHSYIDEDKNPPFVGLDPEHVAMLNGKVGKIRIRSHYMEVNDCFLRDLVREQKRNEELHVIPPIVKHTRSEEQDDDYDDDSRDDEPLE